MILNNDNTKNVSVYYAFTLYHSCHIMQPLILYTPTPLPSHGDPLDVELRP